MTERDAFLAQAISDYRTFRLLLRFSRAEVPECHPLHYLQMSAEKVAKAAMIALGRKGEGLTHVAFSKLPTIIARSDVARRLGYRNGKSFRQFLKKAAPIFREIDELSPAIGTRSAALASSQQPNVEYPWQARDRDQKMVWYAPATSHWSLIRRLESGEGAEVLRFIETLIRRFNVIFLSETS